MPLWPRICAGDANASRTTMLVSAEVPNAVVYLYFGSLILLYVIVAVHTPMTLYADAGHDDALFALLGRYLAEGQWLGPFSQFTLMKGPGYPAFLALGNWLSLSATLAHALFHCLAVTFFVGVAHRFLRSYLLSGLLFALLLWHPTSLAMSRILRERIYSDQLLILLAAFSLTLFGARSNKERAVFALISGAALGWFWLTREEGMWILPVLALLIIGAAFYAYRDSQIRELATSLVLVVGVFAAMQIGFRAINWLEYGKFVGVDFKERNFQRALSALTSVRSGETKPYIPVTAATRKLIYEVSPTFALLANDLEGPVGQVWVKPGGEIPAGWFMWALRDAARQSGHFSSPTDASTFFGRLADEIESACARGELKCAHHVFSEMPDWTWDQLAERLGEIDDRVLDALLFLNPSPQMPSGSGDQNAAARILRFLGNPPHTRIAQSSPVLVISGWYYRSGAEWISIAVKRADGSMTDTVLERHSSPDIATHFGDPLASVQRYRVSADCNSQCILQIETADGERLEKKFAELAATPLAFPIGNATFYVDTITVQEVELTRAEATASRLRTAVFTGYKYVLIPVIALGAIAFIVSTLVYWKPAFWNVCFVLASAFWLLVLSRVALLSLIELTSFRALNPNYMAPAHYMLICAAIFSGAALLQLRSKKL